MTKISEVLTDARKLREELKVLMAKLTERSQTPGNVPASVAEAIAAWKLAADKFYDKELKPDPQDRGEIQ